MTPEQLTETLKKTFGDRLVSAVLYGSAAVGDHRGKGSDYNVLAVLDGLAPADLRAFAKTAAVWVRAGNPPPIFFDRARLPRSVDAFPIEFTDIREHRRLLHGTDPFTAMRVDEEHYRLAVERELRVKLLQARQAYLAAAGDARALTALLTASHSSFLTLLRAALRLFQPEIPAKKLEALTALRRHVELDESAFAVVERLKAEGAHKTPDADALFERCLKSVEDVADAVDRRDGRNP